MKTKSHFKKSCGMFYLCILIITFTGCAGIDGVPERSVSSGDELTTLLPYFSEKVTNTYQTLDAEPAKQRAHRDKVIFARIRAIDIHYNIFIQGLSKGGKQIGIGTDAISLLLDGLNVVSTVTSVKTILTAADVAVKGVKTSVDKNSYYDSTLNALIAQMNATRQTVLADIYAGLEKGTNQYSLFESLLDMERYFQAGTIVGAVSEVNKSAGQTKAAADKKIDDIFTGNYLKDIAGDKLRKFWKPDGSNANTNNANAIVNWMKEHNILNLSITKFIRSDIFPDARAQAVEDLSL